MLWQVSQRTCSRLWPKVTAGKVRLQHTAASTTQIFATVSVPHKYSCVNRVPDIQHRHLHSCCIWQCSKKNNEDISDDPEVKEWLKKMYKDFSVEGEGLKKQYEREEDTDSLPSDDENRETNSTLKESIKGWLQYVEHKYEKFEPRSTQIIYDYDEEQQRREQGLMEREKHKDKRSVHIPRGETGVFDVEELVEVLRESNAHDVVAIQVPPEAKYVAHMVVVSSQSRRHMASLAEVVRQVYKLKKSAKDRYVQVEGKGSDWLALDLGNIALHIMLPETREQYDLETLWTVGPEFDTKSQYQEQDPFDVFRLPAAPSQSSTLVSPGNTSPV